MFQKGNQYREQKQRQQKTNVNLDLVTQLKEAFWNYRK